MNIADESEELAPDSQFESFYDRDSGAWTLRRIPSSPPEAGDCDHSDMDLRSDASGAASS